MNARKPTAAMIEAWRAELEANLQAQHWDTFPTLPPPVLRIYPGRKFARVVLAPEGREGHLSVYGFIDLTNGDLMKAEGWKGPARNFARGNIFAEDPFRSCGTYSIS